MHILWVHHLRNVPVRRPGVHLELPFNYDFPLRKDKCMHPNGMLAYFFSLPKTLPRVPSVWYGQVAMTMPQIYHRYVGAKAYCASIGGHLPTILDMEQFEAVTTFLDQGKMSYDMARHRKSVIILSCAKLNNID